jgi:hypothetical protein
MRVRFFQPTDESETAEFLATKRKIAAFWQQFQSVCRRPPSGWLPDLRRTLKDIDPALGLEVELPQSVSDVGTPDIERFVYIVPLDGQSYRPLAQAVAELAPTVWPWVIAAEREPLALDKALQRVFSDTRFDLKAARARVGVGRGHGIEVVIGHHLFHGTQDDVGGRVGELLVTTLLGDSVFDKWITSVEVVAAPRPSPLRLVDQDGSGLPLAIVELSGAVDNAIARITDSLPDEPMHVFCERADWLLFEMDDLRRDEQDVSALPLPDLQVATTICPEMLKSFLMGIPFASRRFSRHGERFLYVQLGHEGESEVERLTKRQLLEETLDYMLVPGRLGCVVGAGVGTQFMYIFLALQNLSPALAAINRCLLSQGVETGARVRFCDDEWAAEWVEVHRLAVD